MSAHLTPAHAPSPTPRSVATTRNLLVYHPNVPSLMLASIGNITSQFRNAKAEAASLGVLGASMVPLLKQTIGPCVSKLHNRRTFDLLKKFSQTRFVCLIACRFDSSRLMGHIGHSVSRKAVTRLLGSTLHMALVSTCFLLDGNLVEANSFLRIFLVRPITSSRL